MEKFDNHQKVQESKYIFPYHYIPDLNKGNFSQIKILKWGYEYLSYTFFVLNMIKGLKFDSLLDVGCGDGRFLSEVYFNFPKKRLVGLDYSEQAIKLAKAMNPNVEYLFEDIIKDKLLFKEKFDIITLIETLEHIPPKIIKKFIEKLHFYLKKNGFLVITVPTKNMAFKTKHYQHFDLNSLTKVLSPFFKVKKYYYLNKKSKWIKKFNGLYINRFFIINQRHLKNFFYRNYKKNYLYAKNNNARRICVVCKKS